ncbi:HAMP domain-containing sensor histidine kinase [Kamptonema cortianum]|nr:HAMP domain-containing sensor histidine kinase [Geitlerinema splendidum]MDK3157623.1 HAMP domain-containing sensor histidine kinase [Kamptonema cortianum]
MPVDESYLSNVETASRMLELIHDLGECQDVKQVLSAAIRHYRVLFGDFISASLITRDTQSHHLRIMSLENPYSMPWGGVGYHMIPSGMDLNGVMTHLGKDVTARVSNDTALSAALLESSAPFARTDDVVSVRLAALIGAPCRTILVAPWRSASSCENQWMLLGYPEAKEIPDTLLQLFTTAVETTSRMASYPSLVHYIARQEKINQSIRRNIVHDLKTPITVIRGYAETLKMPEVKHDPEVCEELMAGILESCDRLLADIKDILEPVQGAWKPQKSQFDLALLVHKVVLAEKHTERATHHMIEMAEPSEPILINADERKIRRVLENLLSNAVKYSPGKGNKVFVEICQTESTVEVSFTDQGIGMDEIQLAKVMNEAGRVVDQSLGIEGSGFGLASTRHVVEAHGGTLQAESAIGKGSTFTVRLPLSSD